MSLQAVTCPAVAALAQGAGDAVFLEHISRGTAGVLVATKQQPGLPARVVPEPGHGQCIDGDVGCHVAPQGPARLAAEQRPVESGQRSGRNRNTFTALRPPDGLTAFCLDSSVQHILISFGIYTFF